MKNNNSIRNAVTTAILIMCLLFGGVSFAYAEGGNGSGNGDGAGNGENRDIALTLESASVKDGETNVPINPILQLDFNKNICNVLVLSNNKLCYHLTEVDGDSVPIELIFPDDQVQKDYKRQAFIVPQDNLKPDTQYRIAVDSTLMAKNGNYIDNAHVITFTTGSSEASDENPILQVLGDNVVTYETSASETGDSVPIEKNALDDISQDNGPDSGMISVIGIAVIAIIILISTAVIIKRRKQHVSK